jgi:hypothetical protein
VVLLKYIYIGIRALFRLDSRDSVKCLLHIYELSKVGAFARGRGPKELFAFKERSNVSSDT